MADSYKLLYKVAEVAEIFGTGKNYIYELINSKQLPALRVNNSFRVRGSDLKKYIENMEVI